MTFAFFLLADQTTQDGSGSGIFTFTPLILIAVLFYFIMIVPMRKQEKQRLAMVSSLKKNDKVINSGGIIGIVDSVKEKEDEVVLKGGLRVTRSSIVRVVSAEEGSRDTAAAGSRTTTQKEGGA